MRVSISRILSQLADDAPARVVAIADEGGLTALELDLASNRLARAYLDLGVRRNSLVTVSLQNSLEAVIVCAAIWKAGATPQPISPDLAEQERREIEVLSRPALVVGAESATGLPWLPSGWSPEDGVSDAALPDAWAHSWKAPTSSGSTGRPKVVLATAPALMDPTAQVAEFLPRSAVQLVSGPLMHSASFTYAFRGLLTGHRLVVLPRFDPARVLAAIHEHHVTWALLVPTMIHRLLRIPAAERPSISSLETVLHMGAPLDPIEKRALIDWIGAQRLVEVYAGSESNGLTMIRGDEWLQHPGSVGRGVGGTTIRILRDDETEAAAGQAGQIWMHRAGNPTYQYLGAPSRRTEDGWDTLGDLGYLDPDGYLHVLDRAADVIRRDGADIYPVDIEQAFETHSAVRSALAYPVPDERLGHRISVLVDVADAPQSDELANALLAFARRRLTTAQEPSDVALTSRPLRNDAGKARRSALSRT